MNDFDVCPFASDQHCIYCFTKSIKYMLKLIHLEMDQHVHMRWYCIIRF